MASLELGDSLLLAVSGSAVIKKLLIFFSPFRILCRKIHATHAGCAYNSQQYSTTTLKIAILFLLVETFWIHFALEFFFCAYFLV